MSHDTEILREDVQKDDQGIAIEEVLARFRKILDEHGLAVAGVVCIAVIGSKDGLNIESVDFGREVVTTYGVTRMTLEEMSILATKPAAVKLVHLLEVAVETLEEIAVEQEGLL